MSRVKSVAIGVIVVVIVIAFIVFPIYVAYLGTHPKRCVEKENPSDLGLSYYNFTVLTKDGVKLYGWVIKPLGTTGKRYVVIIMHGYTSCRARPEILKLSAYLAKDGYWVVLFDFRAHGVSGGSRTTIGPLEEMYDAKAILNYVSRNFPGYKIGLIGYSMGAAVAYVLGANDPRVSAIVADSPYPELRVVVPRWLKAENGIPQWYSYSIVFWGRILYHDMNLSFGPMSVSKVDKPLLVIVGTKDPLVTVSEAKIMAGKSPCGDLLIGYGAGHVRTYQVVGWEKYIDSIETTLMRTCS